MLSRQAATIDTILAAHFFKVVGIFPPGTMVTLANGEIAVVVRRTLHPTQPVVRSLRSRQGVKFPELPKRSTRKEAFAITDISKPDYLLGVDLPLLWPSIEINEESDS